MSTTTAAPPAPASPPPPLSRGGRTAIRVALIVAAVGLIVAVVASLTALAWGLSRFRVIADTMALPTTVRALTVDTGSMPVAIRIIGDRDATEPRVDLRMVAALEMGSNPLSVSEDSRTARVAIGSESPSPLPMDRAGEIRLVLPPEVAQQLTVTAVQHMGVLFAEADLDQLITENSSGAVILGGSARTVDITNDHGEVITRRPITVTESFRAASQSGDINVDFAAAPTTVDVATRDGDVVLALPVPGPYLVNATTGRQRGSTVVGVPQTRDEADAAAVVTAHSEAGDVLVEELH